MRVIMVGDFFLALSMGISLALDDAQNWKFQLGENFTAEGLTGLIILLGFFTFPFIASAIWAATRTRAGGTKPPLAANTQARSAEKEDRNTDGFRLQASPSDAC